MTIATYIFLALSLALVLSLRRIGPKQIEWWLIYAVMVASACMGGMVMNNLPAGYKLVPIEPTEIMVVCGFESEPDEFFSSPEEWAAFEAMSGCQQAAHKARLCYAAMLNFAPEPPQSAAFNDDQIVAAARALCNRSADAMNINREDNWAIYGDDYLADAKAMLEAALQSKDVAK